MTTTQLPRQTYGGEEQQLERGASDLYEALRLLPQIEIVDVRSAGIYPIYQFTTVEHPVGVLAIRGYLTLTGEMFATGAVAWARSDDERQPGLRIDEIEGVPEAVGTANDDSTVTLMIVGRR